jgi:hypothetical protein
MAGADRLTPAKQNSNHHLTVPIVKGYLGLAFTYLKGQLHP